MRLTVEYVAAQRGSLRQAGFRPVPVYNAVFGDKNTGKAPWGFDWQLTALAPGPLPPPRLEALNTGILCNGLRAVDLDIDNLTLAEACQDAAQRMLGTTLRRFRVNSPRCLLLYRAAEGEPHKITMAGRLGKIEVLGHNNQFVAFGGHFEGADLEWEPHPPGIEVLDGVPTVSEAAVAAFLQHCAPIIDAKYEQRTNGKDQTANPLLAADPLRVASALQAIPNADPADWEAWNRVGMAVWAATAGATIGWELFNAWSARNAAYDVEQCRERWNHYPTSPPSRIGAGTIFHLADEARAKQGPDYQPEPPPWPDEPPQPEKPALRLRFGFDATHGEPLGTVVDGILHAGSLTLIYGPPKSGKSFLATDLALSIAAGGTNWMGHRITRPGPVLYVACEGHAGFWKRLTAAAQHRGWNEATFPSGFILATGRPMLIRAEARGTTYAPDPSAILEALAAAKARGCNPVAIVIDTVFRSFGAGNVNASPDMNVYLAATAVFGDQGYAVALVHHEIKAGGTPAGSVSLIGGTDNLLHVWREEEGDDKDRRFWQVEYAKDDAETEPRAFMLKVLQVGLDPDGQPATSCVVTDSGSAPEAKPQRDRKPRSAGSHTTRAFEVLMDLCAASGATGYNGVPPGLSSVPADWWRDRFYDRAMPGEEQATKRQAFHRATKQLIGEHRVGMAENRVWIANP